MPGTGTHVPSRQPELGFLVRLLLFFFMGQIMALYCRRTIMQHQVFESKEAQVDSGSSQCPASAFPGPPLANLNVAVCDVA